jgi:hypothetical protein
LVSYILWTETCVQFNRKHYDRSMLHKSTHIWRRSSGKNLYDTYFNLYGEAEKSYELIITEFSDPFLCIVSSSTDSIYIHSYEPSGSIKEGNCWPAE